MPVRNRRLSIAGGLFGVLAAVSLVMPSSLIVEQAGPAIDVTGDASEDTPILTISGASTYPSDTQFYMTTVSAYGTADMGVPGAQALLALFMKDSQTVPVRSLYSAEQSAEQVDEQNAQLMTSSQDSAAVAGLAKAGYTTPMTLSVAGVADDSGARDVLQEGDVLTSITYEGTTTQLTTFADLSTVLADVPGGKQVVIGFTRDGNEREGTVTTSAYEADSTGWVHPGSRLGIYVNSEDLDFPVDISYGVNDIGGPSAGNMFALAIYDKLTEGSLGGDNIIAGTGTVSYSGEIGAIGGIQHKLVGAAEEGATYFLAPAENCAETIGYEPDNMQIFAVRTLDDSIAAAEAIGNGDTSGLITCRQVVGATE